MDNSPNDRFSPNSLIDLSYFEESDNYRWFVAGFNSSFYHVSSDSNYYSQYINNIIAKSSYIHLKNSISAIGSDSGIYFTTPTLKSTTKRLEFAVNTIRTSVEITDPLFSNLAQYPNSRPGFEFPKDSNSYGIYSANFTVAAKKASQSNFKVYPLRGFAQAFSPGPITSSGGLANGYLVRVLKQEIINHKLNFNNSCYSTPGGIKDCPAYGDPVAGISIDLAPFFDFNNDGGYNPQDGDYPIIKGDEALYWINHPSDLNLELEYHWMMYGFNSPTLDQTIFLQHNIVSKASTVFDSLKIGLFIDADIGNARDDYMGSDSLNNLLYFYNGDQFDEERLGFNGYGNTSPAVGIKFLSDSMENSIYFTSSNLANGVPYSVQHWMNFMNSKWKDGQSIKYGGDGYQSSGASNLTTNYMYTGNPVAQTGWTEAMPGGGQASNPPGDRRLFGSMPYFSLQPNLRKTIEIAVGYGRTSDTSQIIGKNIAEMTNVLNQARAHWDTISTPTLTFATNDTSNTTTSIQNTIANQSNLFIVFPVPSSGKLNVETEENMVLIEVYDMKASQILSLSVNQKQTHISLAGYQNGFYLIRV